VLVDADFVHGRHLFRRKKPVCAFWQGHSP
jgi:hypothetical protein